MTRSDYDFDELVQEHGEEYVQEYYPDDMLYPMEMIGEIITDVWEALRSSFFGYDYNPYRDENREQFNPNRDYFAFNGYGNLVSIDAHDYTAWLSRMISENEFIDWCAEQGYIDEDEDEEIEGVGYVNVYEPIPSDAKSFYGKAIVIDDGSGKLQLKSYNTIVAVYNKRTKTLTVNGWYSATTARHIRAFAAQLGISLPAGTKIAGKYKA